MVKFLFGILDNKLSFSYGGNWRKLLACCCLLALFVVEAKSQNFLTNGFRHFGNVAPAGSSESWTFAAAAGDSIAIRVGGTNLTPAIRLFAPDNSLVVQEAPTASALRRDTWLSARAEQSGNYTVMISGAFANQTGGYGISLAVAPGEIVVAPGDEGGPVQSGARNTGNLDLGDLDVYQFSAQAGDSVVLRAGAANATPWIRIFAPDGSLRVEAAPSASTLTRDSFVSTTNLAQSGTYTIVMSSVFASQTGAYEFTLAKSPGAVTVSAGDEGGPLDSGAKYIGSLSVGDLDIYTFNGQADQTVVLRAGSGSLTPWIRVFAPSGALAAEAAPATSTLVRDSFLSLRLTEAGPYNVVIGGVFPSQSGSYELSFAQIPDEITVSPGDEGGPLESGARNTATLTVGDLDFWTFSAEAGESVILRMGSGSFTPWIRVFAPSGALAAEAAPATSALVRDTFLSLRLTEAGPYHVVVGAVFPGQNGSYELSFAQIPDEITVSPGDDGGPLESGARNTGTLSVGDLDFWTFSAEADESVILRMGSDSFTPWIRLFGPDGELVAEAAPSASALTRDSFLSTRMTSGGVFTVVVGAVFSGQSGDYILTLVQTGAEVTVTPGDSGGPLLNGATNHASLNVGDLDLWSFIATIGDSNVFRVTATNFTPWLRVYGPTGALVAESFQNTSTLIRTATLSYEVTANPGEYKVIIGAVFANQSGGYNFKHSRWAPDLNVPETQTINEGETLSVAISAQDPDEPQKPLQFELVAAPPGVTLQLSGPTNALVSWPTGEATGPSTNVIVARVIDVVNGRSFVRTNQFTVVVSELNTPPQIAAIPAQVAPELSSWTVQAVATDTDLPVNALSFRLDSAPEGMIVNADTGLISWTPSEAQGPGSFTVRIVVTDDNPWAVNERQMSTTNAFEITVREVNQAPSVIVPETQVIDEMVTASIQVSAADPDLPANPLLFRIVSAPPGLTLNPSTGLVSWNPTEAQGPSTNLVMIAVTDSSPQAVNIQELSATNSFTIIVREVNSAPQAVVPATQTIDELTAWSVIVSAVDSDLPTNRFTLTLASAPPGVTLDPATGQLGWTPTEAQGPSTNTITIVATDDGTPALSGTNSFTVIVREVNSAPILEAISDRSALNGAPFSLQVAASDPDVPGNVLTYSLTAAPAGMTISADTGLISWTPTQAQVGEHTVTVQVTDNGTPALSASRTFKVTVTGVELSLAIQPLAAGLMQLRIIGDLGLTYELQVSGDLNAWRTLHEFRLNTSPFTHIDPESPTQTHRFYRLQLKP